MDDLESLVQFRCINFSQPRQQFYPRAFVMLDPLHNVQTVLLRPYFIIILLLTSLAMHWLFISCSEGSECTYSVKNFFSFAYMLSKATVSLSIATFKLKHTRTPAGQYFIK